MGKVMTGSENGDSDPILPYYRTQCEEAYAAAAAKGWTNAVVVVLDVLDAKSRAIMEGAFPPDTVKQMHERARKEEMTSMAVGGWKEDSAKHFLRSIKGSSEIIDAINGTGKDFPIFIMDADGPRWFNCPLP